MWIEAKSGRPPPHPFSFGCFVFPCWSAGFALLELRLLPLSHTSHTSRVTADIKQQPRIHKGPKPSFSSPSMLVYLEEIQGIR